MLDLKQEGPKLELNQIGGAFTDKVSTASPRDPESESLEESASLGSIQTSSLEEDNSESRRFDNQINPADPITRAKDQELIQSWLTAISNSSETRRAYFRVADELVLVLHPMAFKDATLPLLQNFIEIKKFRKPKNFGSTGCRH